MPQDSQGRYYADEEAVSGGVVASAARTASGDGTAFDTPDVVSLTATLAVTDRDGTNPTLDVELYTSGDGGSTYEKVGQFTQVTAGVPTVTVATTIAGDDDPATNEVQTVTLANVDGGTFTLTYSGQTTAAIAYGATGAAVVTALEALSNIGSGDVAVAKAADVYTITVQGALAATDVAELTANAAGLNATDLMPEVKVFGPLGSKSRWSWVVGGTGSPTFTFAVTPVTAHRDN